MEPVWSSFRLDPRRPEHASLRASDADRAIISGALAEAYADGRLSAQEHDERETANQAAKTLGELPPLLADLVLPEVPSPSRVPDVPPSGSLHRQAVREYVGKLWEAGAGTATPFVICTAIWLFTTPGRYFWPMWVLFPFVLTVGSMLLGAPSEIRRIERKLESKAEKARRRELDGRHDAEDA